MSGKKGEPKATPRGLPDIVTRLSYRGTHLGLHLQGATKVGPRPALRMPGGARSTLALTVGMAMPKLSNLSILSNLIIYVMIRTMFLYQTYSN